MLTLQKASQKPAVRVYAPAALYAALILAVSHIPNLPGPPVPLPQIDKAAHFVEYGILTWLIWRVARRIFRGASIAPKMTTTFIFVSGFGAMDEYLQGFVAGRSRDVFDWLTDTAAGAVIVLLLGRHARAKS